MSNNANEPAIHHPACEIVGRNVRRMHDLRAWVWNYPVLGKKVGLGQGTISGIECVERCPFVRAVFRLAAAFSVETERLVRVLLGRMTRRGKAP